MPTDAKQLYKLASLFSQAAHVIDFNKFKQEKQEREGISSEPSNEETKKQRMAFFRAAKSGWLDFAEFDRWSDRFPLLFDKHFSYAIVDVVGSFLINKNMVDDGDPTYSPTEKEITGVINYLIRKDPLAFLDKSLEPLKKDKHGEK